MVPTGIAVWWPAAAGITARATVPRWRLSVDGTLEYILGTIRKPSERYVSHWIGFPMHISCQTT